MKRWWRRSRPARAGLGWAIGLLAVAAGLRLGEVTGVPVHAVGQGSGAVIHFEGDGAESGVTGVGATEFAIFDTHWEGGVVVPVVYDPMAPASYALDEGVGRVRVPPAVQVSFRFFDGPDWDAGIATAYDAFDNPVGELVSIPVLGSGLPVNWQSIFATSAPIVRVEFVGGVVDDFCFVPAVITSPDAWFRRGDTNGSGFRDIADAIALLSYLSGGPTLPCVDAADVNDDGEVGVADAIYLLGSLFLAHAPPPAIPTDGCGPDPTADALGCASFASCE